MDGAQQEDSQYRPSRIGKRITNAREKVLVYDLRGGDVFFGWQLLGYVPVCEEETSERTQKLSIRREEHQELELRPLEC